MKSPKNSRKIFALVHRATCVTLLFINLAHLTAKYLAYDTAVDVGFYTPVTLTSPNLSLCFDLNTVLGGHEILVFNNHTPQHLGMTSQELFERVPRVDRVLKKCSFRDLAYDRIVQANNPIDCSKLFTIKRYRLHSFMCYLFHLNKRDNFSFNALAFSLNEPKLLYKVAIGGPLTNGHTVAPLVHFDQLADVDRIYMKELFPSKKNDELYHLEYDLYEIERMPHPYTTQCGPEPMLRCLYTCFGQGYAKYGLTASSGVVQETPEVSSLRVVKHNGSKTKSRDEVNSVCSKLCTSEACSQKLVITHIAGPFESESGRLVFNIGSYKNPINLIKYSPKLLLADYATQVFSLAGIWIGFSVVSLIFRTKSFDLVKAYRTWTLLMARMATRNIPSRAKNKDASGTRAQVGDSRKKARKGHKLICASFKMTTLAIFSIQAFNLCYTYAKYETILKYHHALNPEFPFRLPSTAICLNLKDLFSSRRQTAITEENYEDLLTHKNIWIKWTMDKIFNQTLDDDILLKCRVKSYEWTEYFKGEFELKSKEECLKEFTYHKYYSRWQMCYLFKPKELPNSPDTYQQSNFAFGELNPSKLYSLILNPKIKYYETIDLVVYFDSSNASYISSEFRAVSPSLAEKRVVTLTFHTLIFKYLPAPYDTRCDSASSESMCRTRCRQNGLIKLGRIPYPNLVKPGAKEALLSFEDLKNTSVNQLYWQVENHCHRKCQTSICSGNFTLTYSRHATGRSSFDVEVVVSLESIPRIHFHSEAYFELYDFYYQIFCLLAFWLGFSFIGLNLIQQKQDKRFNEAAEFLHTESIKLLDTLKCFRGKSEPKSTEERHFLIKRVICRSICALGMCFHLISPIWDYLAYPTKLMTTIYYEDPISFKLIICSEAQNLFERKILFGNRRKEEYLFDKNLDEILTESKKLTHLMTACGYWGLSKDEDETNEMKKITDRVFFESNNSSVCEELFHTKVFLKQGLVCFEYKLRRMALWNRCQMLGSINEAKTALSVSFNSSLISPRFTVISHQDEKGTAPLHTSVWSPTVFKKPGDHRFVVSYTSFIVSMLAFPYSEKGFIPAHITYCLTQCTNSRMRQFNLTRIGFGDNLPSSKLLSNAYRNNSLVNNLITEVDRECDRRCLMDKVFRSTANFYMVTLISEPLPSEGGQNGSTRFDLRRTDDPVITMKFLVAISFYDLVINIGSVISIWFGLSVINIPHLATEKDFEKVYIKTTENLNKAKCILEKMSLDRSSVVREKVRQK